MSAMRIETAYRVLDIVFISAVRNKRIILGLELESFLTVKVMFFPKPTQIQNGISLIRSYAD